MSLAICSMHGALLREAQFTRDLLGAGVAQVRRAHYAAKGTYVLALLGLSSGLGRLGQLCLAFDHLLQHGKLPDPAQLNQDVGHGLLHMHERAEALVQQRGLQLQFLQRLNDPVHLAVLRCLQDFAQGGRYGRFDLSADAPAAADPLADWSRSVDAALFQKRVSAKKQAAIHHSAETVARVMGASPIGVQSGEPAGIATNLMDVSYRTSMTSAIAPYRQLYVLHVIRYWVDVLSALQQTAAQRQADVPNVAAVFASFLHADGYLKTNRAWEKG